MKFAAAAAKSNSFNEGPFSEIFINAFKLKVNKALRRRFLIHFILEKSLSASKKRKHTDSEVSYAVIIRKATANTSPEPHDVVEEKQ